MLSGLHELVDALEGQAKDFAGLALGQSLRQQFPDGGTRLGSSFGLLASSWVDRLISATRMSQNLPSLVTSAWYVLISAT